MTPSEPDPGRFVSPAPTGDPTLDAIRRRRAHAASLSWCPACRGVRKPRPGHGRGRGRIVHTAVCPIGTAALIAARDAANAAAAGPPTDEEEGPHGDR